jgi:hypothetical protein
MTNFYADALSLLASSGSQTDTDRELLRLVDLGLIEQPDITPGRLTAIVAAHMYETRLVTALEFDLHPEGVIDIISELRKIPENLWVSIYHLRSKSHLYTLIAEEESKRIVGSLRLIRREKRDEIEK